MDASGPTGADSRRLDTARLDTAQLDTGQLDTGRLDSRRPTAGPSGRRPQVTRHRTAGQPDPGRQDRMGGHRLLDTGDRRRGVPAGRVDHGDNARPLESGWTLLWADAVWASNPRTAQQQGRRGHPRRHGQVWPPPRPSAAGGTPPSSWRLGALLSSDDYGSSVERTAHGQVLCEASAGGAVARLNGADMR